MEIKLNGLYLTRTAREVGIVRDRGVGLTWRWVTTLGYYVRDDGRAAIGGDSSQDLVRDISLTDAMVHDQDEMFGVISGHPARP